MKIVLTRNRKYKKMSSHCAFKLSEIEIPLSPTDNKKDKIAFI